MEQITLYDIVKLFKIKSLSEKDILALKYADEFEKAM